MTELERYRRALQRIRDYDASKPEGYLDEWQEASAFHTVQDLARDALEPGYLAATQKAARDVLSKERARVRELRRSIGAKTRWFYRYNQSKQGLHGVWVRVLPEKSKTEGCVKVTVLESVGAPDWTCPYVFGSEFSVRGSSLVSQAEALSWVVEAKKENPVVVRVRDATIRAVTELYNGQYVMATPETFTRIAERISLRLDDPTRGPCRDRVLVEVDQDAAMKATRQFRVRALGVEVVI